MSQINTLRYGQEEKNLHDKGAENDECSDEKSARKPEEVLWMHWWVMLAIPVISQCVKTVYSLIHVFENYLCEFFEELLNLLLY